MNLTLGFSPCPNDTFIFDALIHQKIDTGGYTFDVTYDDVETLNHKAFEGQMDITKLSFHAFAYAVDKYELLDAGSALGFGVGPLLIAKDVEKKSMVLNRHQGMGTLKVGVPGKYTTANFLLGLAFPELINKEVLVFSEIESALLAEEIDLGLIIHENRFTYEEKGLIKVRDLGDFWEKETNQAIPLGGIVIRRDLEPKVKKDINRLVKESVKYAFANPEEGMDYIRSHAQEMEEKVIKKHIELYVNKYSEDLGEQGKLAIRDMMARAVDLGIIPSPEKPLFLI